MPHGPGSSGNRERKPDAFRPRACRRAVGGVRTSKTTAGPWPTEHRRVPQLRLPVPGRFYRRATCAPCLLCLVA